MATLTNKTIASTYTSLLKLEGDTGSTVASPGAAVQVKTGDNDATPLYLNTDRIGIGGQPSYRLSIEGTDATTSTVSVRRNSNDVYGSILNLRKSRGTSVGDDPTVNNNDYVGEIYFYGSDGTNDIEAGAIKCYVNGTPGANDMPGALEFRTTSDGASSSSGRMTINSAGNVIINNNLGIGLSVPTAPLHVKGANNSYVQLWNNHSDANIGGMYNNVGHGVLQVKNSSGATKVNLNSDSDSYFTGGSLGIGTATPSSYDAGGNNLVIYENGNAGLTIATGTGNTGNIHFADGTSGNDSYRGIIQYNHSEDALKLATSGNNRLVINDESSDFQSNYIVNEQGRQNHVANTMSSPYYRFDGVNDEIAVADNANLTFGNATSDNPFSISAWIHMEDATHFSIATKNDTGLGEYRFLTDGDDKLQFLLADASSSGYEYAFTSAITAYENQWIHVVATYNGVGGTSANAGITLYINGVSQALTLADSGSYTAMENTAHEFRIGNLHNSSYARGSISCLRVWNKELTTSEIKDDYSGASVAWKYKGANQTSVVTGASSDMSGAGSWNFAYLNGSNNNSTVSNKMYLLGNGNDDMAFISSILTKGKAYSFSLKARLNTGSSTAIRFGSGLANSGDYVEFTPTGTEQTFTGTFVANSTEIQLGTTTAMGSMNGIAFEIDDVLVYPIGAVCEFDGSSAGEKVWGDKSGNDLHGTVSGATLENTPYDDRTEYETGTFTPVLSDGSNNATNHASTKGIYTKTGNCVSYNMWVQTSSKGSIGASADLRITGLPYVAGNDEHFYSGINVSYGAGLTLSDARENIAGYVDYNNSYIQLQVWDSTAGTNPLKGSDITNATLLMVRGQYWVSD